MYSQHLFNKFIKTCRLTAPLTFPMNRETEIPALFGSARFGQVNIEQLPWDRRRNLDWCLCVNMTVWERERKRVVGRWNAKVFDPIKIAIGWMWLIKLFENGEFRHIFDVSLDKQIDWDYLDCAAFNCLFWHVSDEKRRNSFLICLNNRYRRACTMYKYNMRFFSFIVQLSILPIKKLAIVDFM